MVTSKQAEARIYRMHDDERQCTTFGDAAIETVRDLMNEVESLRAERDALRDALKRISTVYCPNRNLARDIDAALAGKEWVMKDEVFARVVQGAQEAVEINRLRADRDALRQDAERYRWLRDPDCDQWSLPSRFSGDELDREIDRAMPLAGKE